jgi:hypothetical protein
VEREREREREREIKEKGRERERTFIFYIFGTFENFCPSDRVRYPSCGSFFAA